MSRKHVPVNVTVFDWILVLIITIILASGGCQSGQTASKTADTGRFRTGATTGTTAGDNTRKTTGASTGEIINQALTEKRLDRKTTAKYLILAAFDPDKVPAEYRGVGGIEGSDGVQYEINWARQNWLSIDTQTQQEIKRYVVSAEDPDSIFNQSAGTSTGSKNLGIGAGTGVKQALFDLLVLPVVAAGGNEPVVFNTIQTEGAARIHFYDAQASQAENQVLKEKAGWVRESFEKAWLVFKGIFGKEPELNIRVYLRDFPQGSDLWGIATYTEGQPYEIVINRKLDKNRIQATGVHELFHIFQYAYDISLRRDDPDTKWLMEATAVWTEDLIYPEYNTEHRFTDEFFGRLAKEQVVFNGADEYTGFMLFFFLQQFRGHIDAISSIFMINKEKDARESVMTGIPAYENAYAEFSRYNWNQDAFKIYFDNPAFPNAVPYDDSSYFYSQLQQQETDYKVKLNKGSIVYHFHQFSDLEEPVRNVRFALKGPAGNPRVKVQALIKENGVWRNEYWDLNAVKEYCRKNPDTRLNSIVLIFTNSDLKQTAELEYTIDTRGVCQEKITGTTRISGSTSLSGLTGYEFSFISKDEIASYNNGNSDGTAYVLKSRSVNYTSSGKSSVEFPGLGLITSTVTGSGAMDETYNLSDNRVRLIIHTDGRVTFKCDPLKNRTDWVTYISSSSGATATEIRDSQTHCEAEFTIQKEEIINKRLKGTKTFTFNSAYGSMQVLVEYDYTLP